MAAKNQYTVFACGADTKNRFSFFKDGKFYFSGDNGNLEDVDNFHACRDSIQKMVRALKFQPDIIAHDLHPGYFSSKIGSLFHNNPRTIGVQHHHAHIASVLGAAGTKGPVIGVSFDGTGYGTDGHLWGGEFLLVSQHGFERKAHFQYMKMPGGERAVLEPWRLAFSLLYGHLGEAVFEADFPCLRVASPTDYRFLKKIIDRGINLPLTSSCGRLFDAVSSFLDITHTVRSEALAAINLEKQATQSSDTTGYDFDIIREEDSDTIGYTSLLTAMIDDIKKKVPRKDMARRFHNALAKLILVMVQKLKKETGVSRVILSGGVFQNRLLYTQALRLLKEREFDLIVDDSVPLNDLGICAGQTYAALHSV